MNDGTKHTALTIALATLYGGGITGIFSLIAAVFAFVNYDFFGTGLCLLAAAFSFGLMANAVLREGLPLRS